MAGVWEYFDTYLPTHQLASWTSLKIKDTFPLNISIRENQRFGSLSLSDYFRCTNKIVIPGLVVMGETDGPEVVSWNPPAPDNGWTFIHIDLS